MMSRDWANSPIASCSLEPWGKGKGEGFLLRGGDRQGITYHCDSKLLEVDM